jgi:hypothetical protein
MEMRERGDAEFCLLEEERGGVRLNQVKRVKNRIPMTEEVEASK